MSNSWETLTGDPHPVLTSYQDGCKLSVERVAPGQWLWSSAPDDEWDRNASCNSDLDYYDTFEVQSGSAATLAAAQQAAESAEKVEKGSVWR